jgi:large subunit ribosomal protein L6
MKSDIQLDVEIPDGVQVETGATISIKGPKGESKRNLVSPNISLTVADGKVVIASKGATKREKKMSYTFAAHLRNMIKGATEGHAYEMKVRAAHFPMNVSVSGKELIVKNFLGEKHPRVLKLRDGVDVKVDGDVVHITSADKELAGMTASAIEILTKVKNRDRRIFQDGIFITNKDGKEIV